MLYAGKGTAKHGGEMQCMMKRQKCKKHERLANKDHYADTLKLLESEHVSYLNFNTICSLHRNTWPAYLILEKLSRSCSRSNSSKPVNSDVRHV